jgi:hypothetical protein
MKTTVLEFVGGFWDGKVLRTDSSDYEEQLLAVGCYEMSHHGAIGGACVELWCEVGEFAKTHGWMAVEEPRMQASGRYTVAERRETETEIIITFKYHPRRGA